MVQCVFDQLPRLTPVLQILNVERAAEAHQSQSLVKSSHFVLLIDLFCIEHKLLNQGLVVLVVFEGEVTVIERLRHKVSQGAERHLLIVCAKLGEELMHIFFQTRLLT